MLHVVISDLAKADTLEILRRLAEVAGYAVAEKYADRFDRLYDRLAVNPEIYQARRRLGPGVRIAVVFPYLVAYRYRRGGATLSIVRVVHGRRRLTRSLLANR